MHLRNTLIFLSLLLSGLSCFGQDSLQVQVVDGYTAEALPFAPLQVVCDSSVVFQTVVDLDGWAVIPALPNCELRVQYVGYQEFKTEIDPAKSTLTVRLQDGMITYCDFPIITTYRVYEMLAPQSQLPPNIIVLQTDAAERQLQTSLAPALNMEAGIRMDERGLGGSRRISIRGSALRSPFAVRNIKLYVDGMALTSPDGSSPLELLDPADVHHLNILKGAAGSVYGPGNGGVLLAGTESSALPYVQTGVAVGSNQYYRNHNAFNFGGKDTRIRLSHVWQENGGYRDQEFNHKNQVTLSGFWAVSDTVSYRLYATHYSGRWGLPGGITWEQAEQDPTQARAFAVANGTHVQRTRNRVGVQRTYDTGRWKNITSVYVNATEKVNPYGTSAFFNGYKEEQAQGYGARTVFSPLSYPISPNSNLDIALGAEWQQESNELREWTLANSAPDQFKYFNETLSTAWTVFGQLSTNIRTAEITAGLSLNQTVYDNQGESQQPDTLLSLLQRFDPGMMVLPRVSVRIPCRELMVHAQGSLGASPPSLFEMINPEDGTFAPDITSERSLNAELGATWVRAFVSGVQRPAGITGYWTRLNNAILPENEVLFANKGRIDLQGAEAWLQYRWGRSTSTWQFHWRSVAAWQQYLYRTYETDAESLSGNYVPGLPGTTLSNQATLHWQPLPNPVHVVELTATHRWNDRTPLNDENTDWAPAYHVLDGQMRYTFNRGVWEISAFGGVMNLFDVLYSNFLQINAFGGRYFNPAPGRSFYSGVTLRFNLPEFSAK